jgi:hypothetical protein
MAGGTIRPYVRWQLFECRDNLDDRHAQMMRHHVMQLAGDPGSLLRDGQLRLHIPLALKFGSAAFEAYRIQHLPAPQSAEKKGDGKG